MMHDTYGWMNGLMVGGQWVWTVVGVLIAVLLVVVINNKSKNNVR